MKLIGILTSIQMIRETREKNILLGYIILAIIGAIEVNKTTGEIGGTIISYFIVIITITALTILFGFVMMKKQGKKRRERKRIQTILGIGNILGIGYINTNKIENKSKIKEIQPERILKRIGEGIYNTTEILIVMIILVIVIVGVIYIIKKPTRTLDYK